MKKIRKQVITNETKIFIPLLLLSLSLVFIFCVSDVSAATGDTVYINDSGNLTVSDTGQNSQITGQNTSSHNTSTTNKSSGTGPDPDVIRGGTVVYHTTISIQDAINHAQTGDTIRLENGATFNEHDLVIPSGITSLTFDVWNAAHNGPGGHATIDAQTLGRIFTINSGVTVNLYNLTLTNGKVTTGGAIYNSGTLTVHGCTFTNNNGDVGAGGAIFNEGTLTVDQSRFESNTAGQGGAIGNTGSLTVTGSSFYSNVATLGYGVTFGGAISQLGFSSSAVVRYCRIIGNSNADLYSSAGSPGIDARYNWWGSNNSPVGRLRDPTGWVATLYNPWVILTVSATPSTINNGGTSTINADFNHVNGGGALTGGQIPDGSITLSIPWGSFTNPGTTQSRTLNTANGAITPITFYANGGAAPSSPVKVTATAEGYTTSDLESAYITINKLANLVITKTGSAIVTAGNPITYTIIVTNNGIDSADNVQIYDTFPPGVSGVSWAATYAGGATGPASGTGNLNLNLGTLPVGGFCTITATGTVLSSTPADTMFNTATVTTTTSEATTADNSATATTIVNTQADLTVSKTGPATVHAGNQITYTITVTNNGPSDAQNVQIQDTIPGILQNVVHDSFNLGTIGAHQSKTVTITGTVPSNTASGTVIQNAATVTSGTSGTIIPSGTVSTTVDTQADLVVSKTGPATVHAGNQITYTITVTNNGPSDAQNVQIVDSISAVLQNVVHDSFNLGTIGAHQSKTVTITGTVPSSTASGTVIVNSATVTSDTSGTIIPSDTVITILDAQAALSVVKDSLVGQVVAGVTYTDPIYRITVTNNGPSDARNVQIQDNIPSQIVNREYRINGGTWTSFTGTLNQIIPYIASGVSGVIEIRGSIPSSTPAGSMSNIASASVYGTTFNSNPVNTDIVDQATLNVVKGSLNSVTAGGTYTGLYTIAVTNNGPSDARNVVVTDTLPFNVVGGSYTVDGGSPVSFSGNSLSVNLGTLAPGVTNTIVINGEVASAAPAGTVTNTANAHTDTGPTHDFVSNQFSTTVNTQSNLSVIMESRVSQVVAGVTYTDPIYRITVTNNGPSDARDVQVQDDLPDQIVNREYRINGGTWTSFTGTLNQIIPYIASGVSGVIEIRGSIPSSTPAGSMSNMASASVYGTTFDSNTVNIAIIISADVDLNKTVDKSRPNVGDTVTFTVTAHNNGPSDARNVQVSDLMPSDFADVTVTPSRGTYVAGVWTFDLASGEDATLTLSGKVTSTMAGKNTTNTASIEGSTDSVNATIYVPKSDLYILITSNKNNSKVGEIFTLTYKLGNNGPDAADNVTITIPLPKGFEISQITGDGNWTYNETTRTITWTFTNIPKGDPYLYISGKVLGPGAYVFGLSISSETYSLNTEGVTPITINAVAEVKAVGKTKSIPMQHTGLPITGLVLAVLAVFSGLVTPRRK